MGKLDDKDRLGIELKVLASSDQQNKTTNGKEKHQTTNFERLSAQEMEEQLRQADALGQWDKLLASKIAPMQGSSLASQRRHIIATHNQILKKTFRKLREETKRVGLNSKHWRCSTVNKNFSLCPTYPPYLIVPNQMTDEDLIEVARYRHFGRIPAVVWRYRKNGAVIARSSQPSVGLLGRRSAFDEKLLGSILENCILDDLDDDDFFEINVCDQEHSFDSNGKPKDDAICSHNYCDNCINHCLSEQRREKSVDTSDLCNGTAHKIQESKIRTSTTEEQLKQTSVDSSQQAALEKSLKQLQVVDGEESLQFSDKEEMPSSSSTSDQSEEPKIPNEIDSSDEAHFNTLCRCECHEESSTEAELTAAEAVRRSKCDASTQAGSLAAERNKDKRLLILDARSFTVAFFNRAMGGGSECAEYYPSCDVDYLYLANIHSVRNAFFSLRSLCDNTVVQNPIYFVNWPKGNNYWLYYLSNLIESALRVVTAVSSEGRPVLIHCSDGWDRTPQLISLAQIMMDSHYRTIKGFQRLIQKDWLEFGHKFADRCGLFPLSKNIQERSPIFLQWLDCVHQLVKQFPDWFEFNLTYLEELAFHTYSPLFGTFYCNNYLERFINRIYGKSNSVWAYLDASKDKFVNGNYIETDKVMTPSYDVAEMIVWKELYNNLIDEEFLSRFDLKSCSNTQNGKESGPPVEDYNFTRRRRLFRTVSLDYISRQVQNEKELRQNCGLRRYKSEPCLRPPTAGRTLAQFGNAAAFNGVSGFGGNGNGGGSGNGNKGNDNGSDALSPLFGNNNTLNANGSTFLNGSLNGWNHTSSSRQSTGSLCTASGSCKLESGSGNNNNASSGGFGDSECFQNQVPLSVISKIAQVANGNPESSLMYSILSYVSSLYTFSVK